MITPLQINKHTIRDGNYKPDKNIINMQKNDEYKNGKKRKNMPTTKIKI